MTCNFKQLVVVNISIHWQPPLLPAYFPRSRFYKTKSMHAHALQTAHAHLLVFCHFARAALRTAHIPYLCRLHTHAALPSFFSLLLCICLRLPFTFPRLGWMNTTLLWSGWWRGIQAYCSVGSFWGCWKPACSASLPVSTHTRSSFCLLWSHLYDILLHAAVPSPASLPLLSLTTTKNTYSLTYIYYFSHPSHSLDSGVCPLWDDSG